MAALPLSGRISPAAPRRSPSPGGELSPPSVPPPSVYLTRTPDAELPGPDVADGPSGEGAPVGKSEGGPEAGAARGNMSPSLEELQVSELVGDLISVE